VRAKTSISGERPPRITAATRKAALTERLRSAAYSIIFAAVKPAVRAIRHLRLELTFSRACDRSAGVGGQSLTLVRPVEYRPWGRGARGPARTESYPRDRSRNGGWRFLLRRDLPVGQGRERSDDRGGDVARRRNRGMRCGLWHRRRDGDGARDGHPRAVQWMERRAKRGAGKSMYHSGGWGSLGADCSDCQRSEECRYCVLGAVPPAAGAAAASAASFLLCARMK